MPFGTGSNQMMMGGSRYQALPNSSQMQQRKIQNYSMTIAENENEDGLEKGNSNFDG